MPYSHHHKEPAPSFDSRRTPYGQFSPYEQRLIKSMRSKVIAGTVNPFPDDEFCTRIFDVLTKNIEKGKQDPFITPGGGLSDFEELAFAICIGLEDWETNLIQELVKFEYFPKSSLKLALELFDLPWLEMPEAQ